MKKLSLVCLMMLAGSAWAEWVMYDWNDTTTYFFDPATIRKDGNMRRVWQLEDLRKRDKLGGMSRRGRFEYDCKQERYRYLDISGHSEPMGGGEVLGSGGESTEWNAIPPGTPAEKIFNIVCAT